MVLSQRRIGWLLAAFMAVLAVAAARALQLGTLGAGRLTAVGAQEYASTGTVIAQRGSILDRNGDVLAITEPAEDVSATPYQVAHPLAVAQRLAPLLGVSANTLMLRIEHPTSPGFVYLARQVPQAAAKRVAALHITGIALTSDPKRVYPQRDLAAQVLGGLTLDGLPTGGVEYGYQHSLAGTNGWRRTVYANGGKVISVADQPAAHAGSNVQLTIDSAVQQSAERALAAVGAEYHPRDATAIVLDLHNNAVLATANWPRVNANHASSTFAASNHAVSLTYEPGSTFKVVAIGGALSDGLIAPNTPFRIPDQLRVADRVIHDDSAHPTETLTVSQILKYSSNIGAVKIGALLGPTGFASWVTRFGFGTPTGVDLPGEEQGIVLAPSQYSGSSMGNLPIGQGESVTPMQMATAYAAIANGGILRTPHVVASVGGVKQPVPKGHRILTHAVAAELRRMLEGVLTAGGTASQVSIPGYVLAGKTGTANKVVNGVYSTTHYVASFIGFAPAHNPKVLIAVIVDDPTRAHFGAQVAAPAWEQIMKFTLGYMMVPSG